MSEIIPLRFGTRLVFSDRWAGRVTGFEIDEAWEILNILVTDGVVRSTTVKLPLDKAAWTAERVSFPEATSAQAFAREVQPVAAPARPVTAHTPLSMPGTRLAGALVDSHLRTAQELLVSRGGNTYRVPTDQVTFSGKDIVIAARGASLDRYYDDESIQEGVEQAIARSHAIPADESREIEVSVRNGRIVITGNVRTKQAKDMLTAATSTVPGVSGSSIEVVDDVSLEFDIARALHNAGIARDAGIHPRSALGDVTLFGFVRSAESAAEGVRAAARVPGVRSVHDRMEVGDHVTATA
jgi:osmotically-inducible protein OsmY